MKLFCKASFSLWIFMFNSLYFRRWGGGVSPCSIFRNLTSWLFSWYFRAITTPQMLRLFFSSRFFQVEFQPSHIFVVLAFPSLLNTFQIPTGVPWIHWFSTYWKKSPTFGCKSIRRRLSKSDRKVWYSWPTEFGVKMEEQNFFGEFFGMSGCFIQGHQTQVLNFTVYNFW